VEGDVKGKENERWRDGSAEDNKKETKIRKKKVGANRHVLYQLCLGKGEKQRNSLIVSAIEETQTARRMIKGVIR
jgi:hypothetical protein